MLHIGKANGINYVYRWHAQSTVQKYWFWYFLIDQMQTASVSVLYCLNTIIDRNVDIKQLIQPWLRHKNGILKVHTALCEPVQYNVLPQEQGTSVWPFLPFAYFVYLIKLSNLEHFFIFLNKRTRRKKELAQGTNITCLFWRKRFQTPASETDRCFMDRLNSWG